MISTDTIFQIVCDVGEYEDHTAITVTSYSDETAAMAHIVWVRRHWARIAEAWNLDVSNRDCEHRDKSKKESFLDDDCYDCRRARARKVIDAMGSLSFKHLFGVEDPLDLLQHYCGTGPAWSIRECGVWDDFGLEIPTY